MMLKLFFIFEAAGLYVIATGMKQAEQCHWSSRREDSGFT